MYGTLSYVFYYIGVRYSINGERRGKGFVVISRDNAPGSVCSYGWGNSDAKVFCKSLGYMDGLTIRYIITYTVIWITWGQSYLLCFVF